MSRQVCCNAAVCVLLMAPDSSVLLFERAESPYGLIPIVGHLDDHSADDVAALAEATQQVTPDLRHLAPIASVWLDGRCDRVTTERAGHQWMVLAAPVPGALTVAGTSTVVRPRWTGRDEIQRLAERTVAFAAGAVTDMEWELLPGLDPTCALLLSATPAFPLVTLPADDRELVASLAAGPTLPASSAREERANEVWERALDGAGDRL
ncbi:hypothetical protein [Catellatospora sp. NPDC049133]|uniref:hypothetical protein n=1 Tax=Catellatospora sp. NPDC049133 TaxID=3155499 RepID=UPI00340603D7